TSRNADCPSRTPRRSSTGTRSISSTSTSRHCRTEIWHGRERPVKGQARMDFENYQHAYDHIRFKREDGILELRIHTDDGPAIWDALGPHDLHAELGDAFYQVGRDPENLVVILTGTGDEFLVDWNRYTGKRDARMAMRINKEAKDLIQNLLDIDVPVIGAANGPAFVHAELITLSDIVIASERAAFADRQHLLLGYVPGDGTHVWWDMLLGPNRCRHFLLTGCEISAQE